MIDSSTGLRMEVYKNERLIKLATWIMGCRLKIEQINPIERE